MNVSEHILKVLVATLGSLLFVTLLILTNREDTVKIKISDEFNFWLMKFDMARHVVSSCHCSQLFHGVLHLFCHTPQRMCANGWYSCNVHLLYEPLPHPTHTRGTQRSVKCRIINRNLVLCEVKVKRVLTEYKTFRYFRQSRFSYIQMVYGLVWETCILYLCA